MWSALQRVMVGLLAVLTVASVRGAVARTEGEASAGPTPEQVVTKYMEALRDGNFAAAYDSLSKGMVQHKSREDWAKEQQWSLQMSEAKILDFKVYPGRVEGAKAYVPNLLNAQDKFLNQLGVQEHELYTLIMEDGQWKIDRQVLLEKAEQARWFPARKP